MYMLLYMFLQDASHGGVHTKSTCMYLFSSIHGACTIKDVFICIKIPFIHELVRYYMHVFKRCIHMHENFCIYVSYNVRTRV